MLDYKKLTYLMKKRGLTNKDIAQLMMEKLEIKISESAFKNYRQGKNNPRLKILSSIAKILNVKEQDLIK